MRQTSAVVLVAAAIAGAAAVSVSAQQPSLGDLFGRQKGKVQREKGKEQSEKDKADKAEKERQRLFGQPVAPAVAATTAQPTVVCGMTLIPANPQHDPGIRRTPPANGQTFTMKSIVPTECQRPEK